MEKYGRDRQDTNDKTVQRIGITCWLTKATDTDSEYVILTVFSTATVVARELLSVMLYVHCMSYCFTRFVLLFLPQIDRFQPCLEKLILNN
jgi:hypothetical protein